MRCALAFLLVLSSALAGCASPAPPTVHAPSREAFEDAAARFLLAQQMEDGGFGESGSNRSDLTVSLWVSRGLNWWGNPDGQGPGFQAYYEKQLDQLETQAGLSLTNLYSLYLLGKPLAVDNKFVQPVVEKLYARQEEDGGFGQPNEDYIAVQALAIHAIMAGQNSTELAEFMRACRRVMEDANPTVMEGYAEESWYVSNLLLAVHACGGGSTPKREVGDYLYRFRQPDGSFERSLGKSNVDLSTTANALYAIHWTNGHEPEGQRWLRAQQRPDGSLAFSQRVEGPVVKTTAEALLASA